MFYIYIVLCSNRWRLGQKDGFVMIGHCFGGLVIKSLMEEAQKRSVMTPRNILDIKAVAFGTKFFQNLKGVVFYAVPHLGSELKSYFTQFNSTWFGVQWAGILQNLRSHQSRMADLSQSCDNIISQFSINVFAFLEGTSILNMVSIDRHIHPSMFNNINVICGKYFMWAITIIDFWKGG
jgi:hypothetical protein